MEWLNKRCRTTALMNVAYPHIMQMWSHRTNKECHLSVLFILTESRRASLSAGTYIEALA